MIEAAHHTFRAMGTEVAVYGPLGDPRRFAEAVDGISACFRREEQRCSRFRADSELSTVNAHAGHWTPISTPFERIIRLALEHAQQSEGLFDPSVLHAVIAAGYDRDFDEILAGARGVLHPPEPCGRWTEIEVRPGAILLPEGTGVDLGGIAKGWTVDLAAEEAVTGGLPWVLVSAGGDLRVAGAAPLIEVAIEDPGAPAAAAGYLHLDSGAIATSSTARRAWGPDLHHVIDPRTGAPARTSIVQASVWAPTCADAEVAATWALLTGTDALNAVPCALITEDGDLVVNIEAGVAA